MKIFQFFFPEDQQETKAVKQGVTPDGRGWTDPDSLIRSEGAKRHFDQIERLFREQERRRAAER